MDVKTKDEKEVKINFIKRASLMTNHCASKKLPRMITRGTEKVDKYMDDVIILQDMNLVPKLTI